MARKKRREALQKFRDRGLRVSVPDRGDFKLTKPTVKELPVDLLRLLILSPWLVYLVVTGRYPENYFIDGCSDLSPGRPQGESGGDPSGDRSPTGGPKTPPPLKETADFE